MTAADNRAFAAARECYICRGAFSGRFAIKVRDHDHLTGKYRGAAHQSCNMQLRRTYKLPVFFHNFRGYDSHLIVGSLDSFPEIDIRVIGQSMEKYLMLAWGDHIVFKDTLQFMSSSLESLAENLQKAGRDKFVHVRREFAGVTQQQEDLLFRKGVYPYSFMNDWARFDVRELPAIEQFSNRLRGTDCSTADYKRAVDAWTAFSCRSMKDYHDLYLKLGILFSLHFPI